MNFKRKAALLAFVILLGAIIALPATRDELEWNWRVSQGRATDYSLYILHWPKGRHVVEAKQNYMLRIRNDTKRAEISEALKKDTGAPNDPQSRYLRVERYFWKQVTNKNAVFTYKDYLKRYPNGEYAADARHHLSELSHEKPGKPNSELNSTNQ